MSAYDTVEQIRRKVPVIHCITNTVAANFAANAVIAVGGSPIMASDPEEVASVTQFANALTVNIGTCSAEQLTAIKASVLRANEVGLHWILDPVGVAATKHRQHICAELITDYKPAVVRGNASEIMALALCTGAISNESDSMDTRGLDSTITSESTVAAAQQLAKRFNLVVAMSGKRDYVVDSKGRVARIANGDAKMAQVTATGCALTAVIGCFVAQVVPQKLDLFKAVCHCLSFYAVAGELAARVSSGTGSMHMNFLDLLSTMSREVYTAVARPVLDLSLYLVTDPHLNRGRSLTAIVREAVESGATIVQLREKECDSGEFLRRAREVKAICDEYDIPLIINDRCDIAMAVDCAGVHIGQDDLPVEEARKLLGPNKVIGLSVSTPEAFERCKNYVDEIDYIGVGPIFPTNTKKNANPVLGLDKLKQRVAGINHLVVAIGGINESNAQEVLDVPGVNGIAVVTALTMSENIKASALNLQRRH